MSSLNFDQLIRIPFKSQGRDYEGCDCWGQVYLAYRDYCGIELESWEDISAYDFRDIRRLIELHKKTWHSIHEPDKPRIFDVVLMKTQASELLVAHVGMMISSTHLIHTEKDMGPRVVAVKDPFIQKRIVEFRRHDKLVGSYL